MPCSPAPDFDGNVDFSCVGCGKCCKGHHVPLSLSEARDWAKDGGQVIILAEAMLPEALADLPEDQKEHVLSRSQKVRSGGTSAYLGLTFAAYNSGSCMHLDENDMCRIYERRPLVCRIYPMNISPLVPLATETRDCPKEAWQKGPALIRQGRLVDEDLAALIEHSRQLDYQQAPLRAAICKQLGIRTTALKGDGFTAHLPEMPVFAQSLADIMSSDNPAVGDWDFVASSVDVAEDLDARGAELTAEANAGHFLFVPVKAPAPQGNRAGGKAA